MWVVYFNHSDNGGGYADMILDSDLGSDNLVDWKTELISLKIIWFKR